MNTMEALGRVNELKREADTFLDEFDNTMVDTVDGVRRELCDPRLLDTARTQLELGLMALTKFIESGNPEYLMPKESDMKDEERAARALELTKEDGVHDQHETTDRLFTIDSINRLKDKCHEASVRGGWWHDLYTGEPLRRNFGELLMLIVTELAEAMEGKRKNRMDEHLPHFRSTEVEMADALIRIFDFAGGFNLDIGRALVEKMEYNAVRADHRPENRRKDDGKKC